MNPKKEAFRKAFIASVPILCSYLFLGMAYGILMQEAGFGWAASLLTSAVVYTGAFQFVLITFLSSGASILTIAVTALFMNSRQSFYALTFLNDFKQMGRRKLYMIHALTDETYAVNCTLENLPPEERRETMFYLAVLSHFYWTAASVLGGMLGQIIPFDMTVTGITLPLSSKIWVIPTFLPMIAFCMVWFLLFYRLLVGSPLGGQPT